MSTISVRLAVSAMALAAFLTTGAMAQDIGRTPVSGTVTLDAGFTPDPKIVSVASGGRHDTSRSIGGACTGFVSGAPDVRVNYRTASTVPLIFSVQAEGDTTLAIYGPDGRWYCNDDAEGLNPRVQFNSPNTGNYQVWIGTFGGREQIPARLFISEIDTTAIAEPEPVYQNEVIDPSREPSYGTINLAAGFPDDPYDVSVSSGGSLDATSIGEPCRGYVASAPDVRLNYSSGSLPLYIYATSESDTTLVVRAPDGLWYCDDDSNGGLNPQVTFLKPQGGQYDIWVGTYASADYRPATLYVSEVARD
jgi:hypothetical protein